MQNAKGRLFSAIQPSGSITIGNYIGAIQNWISLQNSYECIFSIADLHSVTIPQVPQNLRKNSKELVVLLLACGIDPQKTILFLQSQLSYHTELMWLLNCMTYIGELSRMTQFKDKTAKKEENLNAGLMLYPVLMAADILLYQANVVPIGIDQKQHLELARDLANRFNNRYSPTFTLPQPCLKEAGQSKIYSLQEPTKKMSKSDTNPAGYITMLESRDSIMQKCKRAVTDNEASIYYNPTTKAGISNLLTIYTAFTNKSMQEAEITFQGFGYAAFKEHIGEVIAATLLPIQKRYKEILADTAHINKVLKESRERAEYIAKKTMLKVYKKMGFYRGE